MRPSVKAPLRSEGQTDSGKQRKVDVVRIIGHILDHPEGNKGWTKQYTHVSKEISSKFERKELEVKAGSAVLMISSCLHCGYPNKTKDSVRITVCERFNPLQKIPYLKDPKATMKIPYMGVDYNKITD